MDGDKNVPFFDVIIVGAGWSGLMACKYCLGEGLKTLVLESRDSIGGVWAFTNDTRYGGVMTTTETTSSRCITEISDFPMPEDYPEFPSHLEILAYLKDYCARFDLDRHIRLTIRSATRASSTTFGTSPVRMVQSTERGASSFRRGCISIRTMSPQTLVSKAFPGRSCTVPP